jgi:beta-N-acetylhexosaminidase
MVAFIAALIAALSVPQPTIVQKPIPFGAKRKQEMRAYAKRHYGIDSYRLRDPKVIVEHYTVTSTFQQTFNTFAPNNPDPELKELPGTCAHYVIDRDGTIYQLVPRSIMCRHTVGLNYTSFGIEHVGMSDRDVMTNKRQLAASLRLTRWLQCRYGIETKHVIGHSESLSSPFHLERVERLKKQTHGDMTKATMRKYRARLRAC